MYKITIFKTNLGKKLECLFKSKIVRRTATSVANCLKQIQLKEG
jgi:hypothetical protein